MPPSHADLTALLFTALAGLLVLAGATLDLWLGFRLQSRDGALRLPHAAELARRPLGPAQALLVLLTASLFALAGLSQKPGGVPPSASSLVAGPLLYALAGLLVTSLSLFLAQSSFRRAFLPDPPRTGLALKKGLQYGLAVIPPVILLSLAMSTWTERLGFEPKLQEVFDWLKDERIPAAVRGFMMAAAVVIAPAVEETLFRGILLPALLKGRSFASAALLSGLFFALVHVHAPSLLPLLALSVAFSAGYAATGSLLTPIVMHALFNLTSLLIFLGDAR